MLAFLLICTLIYFSVFFYFLGKNQVPLKKGFTFVSSRKNKNHINYKNCKHELFSADDFIYKRYAEQNTNINRCNLYPVIPVNFESIFIFNCLQMWLIDKRLHWYIGFEVSMGAFIKTDPSLPQEIQDQAFWAYNNKRVDFLLVNCFGTPKLVIEYHGSGHNLSRDAEDRMKIKRAILYKTAIPLLEISYTMSKNEIIYWLNQFYKEHIKSDERG